MNSSPRGFELLNLKLGTRPKGGSPKDKSAFINLKSLGSITPADYCRKRRVLFGSVLYLLLYLVFVVID
jgi:hypothetical protein